MNVLGGVVISMVEAILLVVLGFSFEGFALFVSDKKDVVEGEVRTIMRVKSRTEDACQMEVAVDSDGKKWLMNFSRNPEISTG